MTPQLFLQALVGGLAIGFDYMLIASGLTLLFGIMRVVNFAHGEFYMLGAFSVFLFGGMLGLNYFLTLLICIPVMAALGLIFDRTVFRPTYRLETSSIIVSLGLALILQTVALAAFGEDDKGVAAGFSGVVHLFGATLSKERLMVIPFALVIMGVFLYVVHRTRYGQAMRAVAQDRNAAQLQGINIDRTSLLAFVSGTVLAGLAGALIGPIFVINPWMGGLPVMKAFIIVVLGGMGSIPGAIVGGLVIGLVDSFGGMLASAPIADVSAFLALILVLLIRPKGLFGRD